MRKNLLSGSLAAVLAAVLAAATAATAQPVPQARRPDLVVGAETLDPQQLLERKIVILNKGTGFAGRSTAMIYCRALTRKARCPDAFPLPVPVPSIPPKGIEIVDLPVWDDLTWAPGRYKVTIWADAWWEVAESDEENNVKVVTFLILH